MTVKVDVTGAGRATMALLIMGAVPQVVSVTAKDGSTDAERRVRYAHSDAKAAREAKAALIRSLKGKYPRLTPTEQLMEEKRREAALEG